MSSVLGKSCSSGELTQASWPEPLKRQTAGTQPSAYLYVRTQSSPCGVQRVHTLYAAFFFFS